MRSSIAQEIQYPCQYDDGIFNIAIDIGGSLAKVVFSPIGSNRILFHTVETERIDKFVRLLHSIIESYHGGDYSTTQITATGGGAYKFYELLSKEFANVIQIKRLDEMECLIKGVDAFIHEIPDEVFTYNDQDGAQNVLLPNGSAHSPKTYPYLLVNIGSGVSILKVENAETFSRVGGSSLGGGTLWGLLSLITGAQTYDQMLDWAHDGDNTNVDMLVGDIYGTDYNKIGLKSSNIASSFGKVFQNRRGSLSKSTTTASNSASSTTSHADIAARNKKFKNPDVCKSLLYAISNNIGQIAYLQAKIHNVQNIYFGGSYIRGHLMTMNTLSFAIDFWSQGRKQAFFLKHEGYLGAMGALLSA
ncbi:hypothetical protein HG537_0B00360 [Torulaspora globosa]|uniref:Pantothenate kinase n=1 Tax=Torulaspora globosa TaxID=48254 RepID=A0A7H9HN40_9SACH|nr:hypothetical protein HG537_0B00360 [Torulaspora sp. CBS 2947]